MSTDYGRHPVKARNATFWITHHAAERAHEMNVPLNIVIHVLRNGERRNAPKTSKYRNDWVYTMGAISVACGHDHSSGDYIVKTVLWSTVDGYRRHQSGKERDWRGEDETTRLLASWLGVETATKTYTPDSTRTTPEEEREFARMDKLMRQPPTALHNRNRNNYLG